MGRINAKHLIRWVACCASPLWAALPALADSGLPPQRPTLDPPAIAADRPGDASGRARILAVGTVPYSHGDPSAEEQFLLELINRARADPAAEGLRLAASTDPEILGAYSYFQVDLARVAADYAGYPPRPPLAFNASLIAAARGHSQDMVLHDFQGHTGSNGSTMMTRIEAAGYAGWNALAENVYAYAKSVDYAHAGFSVDWGVPSLGHRANIMNFSGSAPVYAEIGIGIVPDASYRSGVGPLVVTEDFGSRAGGQRFVVGVVYRDDDHDGFYSVGEGIAGVLVSTSHGNFAYTSSSGGYAVPLASSSGGITVWAEGAGLGAAQERAIALAGSNVKADFVAAAGSTAVLDVTRLGNGTGTVTSAPPGIACGTDCSESYAPGTRVTLTADTPFAGSAFGSWAGACAGTGPCTVTMSGARRVVANFVYTGSAYSYAYVQKAFVAYYGRPADPGGQAYWAGRMDAEGRSLDAVIGAFGDSDEFHRRYGGLSHADLVTRIYRQALGREPDAAGLGYYVDELDAGRRSLQSITLDVLNGAVTAPDATVVANRLDVAAHYTAKVAAGCAYGSEADGVDALAGVTAAMPTVAAAKAALDSRCGP